MKTPKKKGDRKEQATRNTGEGEYSVPKKLCLLSLVTGGARGDGERGVKERRGADVPVTDLFNPFRLHKTKRRILSVEDKV